MENQIEIFKHERFGSVRIIDRNGQPWFVGNEVARALGYERPRKAVLDHCKGGTKMGLPSSGGIQEFTIIPEADLFRLIMHSKLPEAEAFQDWVVEEVLPAIRERGEYVPAQTREVAVDVNSLIALVDRLRLADECLDLIKPRTPIGTISKTTGRPRNKIVPAYPRSDRTTIKVPREYRHLFNYMQMTNQTFLLDD